MSDYSAFVLLFLMIDAAFLPVLIGPILLPFTTGKQALFFGIKTVSLSGLCMAVYGSRIEAFGTIFNITNRPIGWANDPTALWIFVGSALLGAITLSLAMNFLQKNPEVLA